MFRDSKSAVITLKKESVTLSSTIEQKRIPHFINNKFISTSPIKINKLK